MEEGQGSLEDSTARETSAIEATPETAKRKRQPRNSACQSCSGLKMKCCPSTVPGCCERCNRMNKQCVPAIPKPRKRRSTNGFSDEHTHGVRITDLLDDSVSPDRGSSTIPTWTSSSYQNEAARKYSSQLQPTYSPRRRCETFVETAGSKTHDRHERNMLQHLDLEYIRSSIDRFRTYLDAFPVIDPRLLEDPSRLTLTRPLTALSTCCVTATAIDPMRERLDTTFRQSLADATIVDGDKSTDLTVGLLIYLSYARHAAERSDMTIMLWHLLASMVRDAGRPLPGRKAVATDFEMQHAALCAYIAAFHVSRLGYNRASPIPWTSELQTCADIVCDSSLGATAQSLTILLSITRVLDDFHISLERSKSILKPPAVALASSLHAESSVRQLRLCKSRLASHYEASAYTAASIVLQSAMLGASEAPDLSARQNLAASIKTYIEDLVTSSHSAFQSASQMQCAELLSVLAILPRLYRSPSYHSHAHELDAVRSMLRPVELLDRLVRRLDVEYSTDHKDSGALGGLENLMRHAVQAVRHAVKRHDEEAASHANGTFRAVNRDENMGAARDNSHEARSVGSRALRGETDECDGGVLEYAYWDALADSNGS
ncbi:hypothetical protein B0A48_08006 [Cryoendolithus antarcticus]|uniref:Zn(2)-C6 fungal-type domain-containing protein n=1 Tax=Cryoendolithus antarcticus TaxID=1507870 RepID=A0A1V8T187_9PEZI|nr:hypothetical protein B0A48_08006 [Cryoendolithus antarcticus]